MPIVDNELKRCLSGGAANTDPAQSIGGSRSNGPAISNALHALFDVVSGRESRNGMTDYRCIYLQNINSTLTLYGAGVYIDLQSTSPDTSIQIALGSSGVGGVEPAIADQNDPPVGLAWTDADSEDNSLLLGDIPAGSHRALWIKRTVIAGAGAYSNDTFELKFFGDSPL